MTPKFICTKHLEWLCAHSDHGQHLLTRHARQGEFLLMEGHPQEAVPYLGCAFDIARVLVELNDAQDHSLVEQMLGLTSLLNYALMMLKQQQLADEVRKIALQALTVDQTLTLRW